MALSDNKSASRTSILHAYDTQQTPVLAAEDLEIQDVFAMSR